MDTFFIEFRDPLFGIVVFFILLFILSFLSYWWGRYKSAKEHRDLASFLGRFDTLEEGEKQLTAHVRNNSLSSEMWLQLAQSFEHQGNYEKSIEIYHALLAKNRDPLFQKDALLLLGKSFFKAGFLERSRQTFLQILSNAPRTPQALHFLILIYEQLQQYDKALEVMESLEELTPNSIEKLYLQCRVLLCDHTLTLDEKADRLIALYQHHRRLGYMIFEWLFTYRPRIAWSHFDQSLSERLCDVLWRLGDEHLDLAIISSNAYLSELFSAKGAVSSVEGSSLFELDTLITLRRCGTLKATLKFEYGCDGCKQISFFPFHRCPHCHAIDSLHPIMSLSKEYFEENNSLQ
jgi:lipopolysaccharide assembly protein B